MLGRKLFIFRDDKYFIRNLFSCYRIHKTGTDKEDMDWDVLAAKKKFDVHLFDFDIFLWNLRF